MIIIGLLTAFRKKILQPSTSQTASGVVVATAASSSNANAQDLPTFSDWECCTSIISDEEEEEEEDGSLVILSSAFVRHSMPSLICTCSSTSGTLLPTTMQHPSSSGIPGVLSNEYFSTFTKSCRLLKDASSSVSSATLPTSFSSSNSERLHNNNEKRVPVENLYSFRKSSMRLTVTSRSHHRNHRIWTTEATDARLGSPESTTPSSGFASLGSIKNDGDVKNLAENSVKLASTAQNNVSNKRIVSFFGSKSVK